MTAKPKKDCPCCSGLSYERCCRQYHLGGLPENALLLMRSRFAAYAVHDADYIIKTTHKENPGFKKDLVKWKREILRRTKGTDFIGLKIFNFTDGGMYATVTFSAHLCQKGKDTSFTEKSFFEKIDGQWLYRDGVVTEGYDSIPEFKN